MSEAVVWKWLCEWLCGLLWELLCGLLCECFCELLCEWLCECLAGMFVTYEQLATAYTVLGTLCD